MLWVSPQSVFYGSPLTGVPNQTRDQKRHPERPLSGPRALLGVFGHDHGMTARHHVLLHVSPGDVGSSQEQLSHRAAIAVFADAADAHLLSHHHAAQVIPCSLGRFWVGPWACELRRIDAGQPDRLAGP